MTGVLEISVGVTITVCIGAGIVKLIYPLVKKFLGFDTAVQVGERADIVVGDGPIGVVTKGPVGMVMSGPTIKVESGGMVVFPTSESMHLVKGFMPKNTLSELNHVHASYPSVSAFAEKEMHSTRASALAYFKYDPVRVKGIVDAKIESDRAAGRWDFVIDNLFKRPRDMNRMKTCLEAVQDALRDEGFYVSFSIIGGIGGGPFSVSIEDPIENNESELF